MSVALKRTRLAWWASLVLLAGCAEIRETVEFSEQPAGPAVVLGGDGALEESAELGARFLWLHERELIVEIHEFPACRELLHQPFVRTERRIRKVGAGPAVALAIGAGLLTVAAVGAARPSMWVGARRYEEDTGELIVDKSVSVRMGVLFGFLGGIFAVGGTVDLARSRDIVRSADTMRATRGAVTTCPRLERPLAYTVVTLVAGDAEYDSATDGEGRVRFRLSSDEVDSLPRSTDEGRVLGLVTAAHGRLALAIGAPDLFDENFVAGQAGRAFQASPDEVPPEGPAAVESEP